MEDLINEFRSEAAGIVEDVEHKLILSESQGNQALLDDIFRGVHTLKGSSRMFGFVEIEKITHELENTFDDIRKGKRKLDKGITNIGLRVMDMVKAILEGRHDQKEYFKLYSQLQVAELTMETKQESASSAFYQVLYFPSRQVFDRGVNPYAAIDEIKPLGETAIFEIFRGMSDEEQQASKQFDTRYEIIVALKGNIDDLEDVFLFMDESEYSIHAIDTSKEDYLKALMEKVTWAMPEGVEPSAELLKMREAGLNEFFKKVGKPKNVQVVQNVTEPVGERPVETEVSSKYSLNYINVKLDRLDEMMKLMSELVSVKAELNYIADQLGHHGLSGSVERLEKITNKFKDNAFSMRLVPLQILQLKLQRLVRDTAGKLGKEVNLITDGLDTEIDKSIISEIEAPLMHIIQNAIDHGLETKEERRQSGKAEKGVIKILAFYSGANVFIQIQDDGRGLDLMKIKQSAVKRGIIKQDDLLSDKELINLIFAAGLTTRENTSAYSGRGVGMDVVINKIRHLRGSIEVTTESGLGTAFTIRLPLSLSIIDALHVKVGTVNYLIPHNEIVSCLNERTNGDLIQKQGHNVKFSGRLLPHINLLQEFEGEDYRPKSGMETSIIILNKNDEFLSVEVEQIIGESQLVIKPVDEALKRIVYLSGIAVLGNGELSFLLDSFRLRNSLKEQNSNGFQALRRT